MPELSVIVPVYRSEQFLEKCLDSILNQTVRDLELILVDDGSPDGSGRICDGYADRDSRVRVIHQKNAGVSAARNRGIRAAQGRFLGFVDADDWILPEMFETLLGERDKADVVMCDVLTVYGDGREEEDTIGLLPESCLLAPEERTPELMLEFAGSACRCLYRRSLLEEKGIFFPTGMKVSEDRVFNLYAMGSAEKIAYVKRPFYMRYVNLESCVNTFHPDYAEIAERIRKETKEVISRVYGDSPGFHRAFLRQYVDFFLGTVSTLRDRSCDLSAGKKVQEIRRICKYAPLRQALSQAGCRDEQGTMIVKKQIFSLYYYDRPFYRRYSNFRETLAEEGFGGVIRKCAEKTGLRK